MKVSKRKKINRLNHKKRLKCKEQKSEQRKKTDNGESLKWLKQRQQDFFWFLVKRTNKTSPVAFDLII